MAAFQVYKPQKMTVLQAIEEREKVFIEADCASAVLKVLEESELILTQGLEKLIKDYHEECTKKMDRINGALEKIVIEV